MFDWTEDWWKIWGTTDLYFPKWHEEFGKFSQAEKKKNDFILESKMAELNQNKNLKQIDQPDAVKRNYFTLYVNELYN